VKSDILRKDPTDLLFTVSGDDFTAAGEASSEVKRYLKLLGLPPLVIRRTIVSMYEAEINMVIHAGGGTAEVAITEESILIILRDKGPGIPDLELAMQAGYSTASEDARRRGFGAGMGFTNMKNNSDSLLVESVPGSGTTVTIRVDLKKRDP
jgi:anti-sigma regulatory factor (Ser/Thr protein kinase)